MILAISLGIPAILLILAVGLFNGLVRKKNQVANAFGSIEAMLKKRHDLIPNLVAACQAYMGHERGVLQSITELRSRALAPGQSAQERLTTEGRLSRELAGLFVAVENYPQLKSDRNVLQLQAALNEVEEQISAARRFFNSSVTDFNNAVLTFPSNLFASMLRMTPMRTFEAAEADRAVPDAATLFRR